MNRLALVLGLFLLLALGVFLLLRDPVRDVDGSRPVPVEGGEPRTALPVDAPDPARAEQEPDMREALATAPKSDSTSMDPFAECTVLGLVVDEDGAPLVDVEVRLEAYKEWAVGHDVPVTPHADYLVGWQGRTDEAGRFEFGVPTPTVERTWIKLFPDEFHDSVWEFYGGERQGNRPPLVAGVNDLGTFTLITTGAIRGRVTDRDGRALAGVEMDVGGTRSTTISRGGETDESGYFKIAHVPPGSHGVKAKLEGYLSGFLKPVEVEAGRITEPVDFELDPAPSLHGFVRDEAGVALAGARVWCWPASSGAGAGANSEGDGSFTVYLPQDEPYSIGEAKLDGYVTYEGVRSKHYDPGTTGIEIVLARSSMTQFLVVDGDSGEPVERFGLSIQQNEGRDAPKRSSWTSHNQPRHRDHPGGRVELAARPGLDRYMLNAPGYTPSEGEIAWDEVGGGLQTLRLRRGASIVGRVLNGEDPVEGVRLVLVKGYLATERDANGEPTGNRVFKRGREQVQAQASDAEGCFRFVGLQRGYFAVDAQAPDGSSATLASIRLEPDREYDAGDLVLLAAGALEGSVLVPTGRPVAGISVVLDDWQDEVTAVTDSAGEFRFEKVSAGEHSLTVAGIPGVLADGEPFPVELAPGETRRVTLDMRDFGTCQVTLTFDFGGPKLMGSQVLLHLDGDLTRHERFGEFGEGGRVTGSVRAAGFARVSLLVSGRGRLVHPTAEIPLRLDQPVEQTIRFDLCSLDLRLGDLVPNPENGQLYLVLEAQDEGSDDLHIQVPFAGSRLNNRGDIEVRPEPRTYRLHLIPAGTYRLSAKVHDLDTPAQLTEVEPNRWTSGRPTLYEESFEVFVTPGAVGEVVLP